MSFSFEDVPKWAYSWCFFFAFMGFMSLFTGISALFLSNKLGFPLLILYLIAALGQAATSFTLFWMCRRSLADTTWYAAQFSH
jgi:uncharacterized membrane-anchored protein